MTKSLKAPPAAAKFSFGDNEAPEAAFQLEGGPFQFAESTGEGTNVPVKLEARSAKPIGHWYWGNIVHDMAGFRSAEKVAIDYGHSQEEALGFLDKFTANDGGLVCDGQFVILSDDDRAAEVMKKKKAGIPYQASIFFDPMTCVMEWVPEGMTSPVNGYQFTGPGVIVREWDLRGVAVCLYGADKNTSTKFSAGGTAQLTFVSQEKVPEMTKQNETPATPAVTREQFAAELAQFTTKFGATNGAKWLGEGKTLQEATELHVTELETQLATGRTELANKTTEFNAQLAAKDQTIEALNTKLSAAAAQLGEPTPVSGGEPAKATEEKNKFSGLNKGTAAFASGIKLPTK